MHHWVVKLNENKINKAKKDTIVKDFNIGVRK